jgi:hypothetical protein
MAKRFSGVVNIEAPWPFTGGTIRRATVDVSGQPFVDLASEARMALLRD